MSASMSYKLSTNGVIDLVSGAFIPANPDNDDYKIYLAWEAAGNTPQPADPTTRQLVLDAMNALNYCTDVASRCTMAGVAFPPEWQTYTQGLKAIASGADLVSTSLPVKPTEPTQIQLYMF